MTHGAGAIAYTCHDPFPSPDINTQQIVHTLLEVTRLGVDVRLTIPAAASNARADIRAAIIQYYGAAGEALPAAFTVDAIGSRAPATDLGRAWFDLRVARHVSKNHPILLWTRDPLAAVASVRAGMPTVFETFRPDFVTRPRFAAWKRALIGSRHLRGIIAHSGLAADAFVAAGMPRARCLAAHNGFSPALMAPVLDRTAARRRLGLPIEARLVVYAGHAVRDKGIDLMIAIAAEVADVHVLILGADPESPEGRWIRAEAQRRGAARLTVRPRVRVGEVAPYLYAADCLVVTPYDEPGRRHRRGMLPIKVYSYMAAGRAILAPRLPDLQEVLTDDETAVLYAPDSPADAVAAVGALLDDERRRDRLATAALHRSLHYTWSARARRIVEFFDDIGCQPRSAIAAAAISR